MKLTRRDFLKGLALMVAPVAALANPPKPDVKPQPVCFGFDPANGKDHSMVVATLVNRDGKGSIEHITAEQFYKPLESYGKSPVVTAELSEQSITELMPQQTIGEYLREVNKPMLAGHSRGGVQALFRSLSQTDKNSIASEVRSNTNKPLLKAMRQAIINHKA